MHVLSLYFNFLCICLEILFVLKFYLVSFSFCFRWWWWWQAANSSQLGTHCGGCRKCRPDGTTHSSAGSPQAAVIRQKSTHRWSYSIRHPSHTREMLRRHRQVCHNFILPLFSTFLLFVPALVLVLFHLYTFMPKVQDIRMHWTHPVVQDYIKEFFVPCFIINLFKIILMGTHFIFLDIH